MPNDLPIEPPSTLSTASQDMHRAILSLTEELDAIDWYRQRAEACADAELREVFRHNGNEEKEHAAMLVEWIRRHDTRLAETMKTFLFTEAPLAGIAAVAPPGGPSAQRDATLGIGSMKGA